VDRKKFIESLKRNRQRIKELGPGIITGGAGDDPAGIVTCTVVGATTGFKLLWLAFLSSPMMIAVQDTVSRIAIVTGKSLPEITNIFYSKKFTALMISILLIANVFTIAADIDAIASILEITTGINSVYYLIPITAAIGYLVVFKQYRTVKRVLIGLTAILVVYVVSAVISKPNVKSLLLNTFVPHISLNSAFIVAALGYLGTKMSPYLLFWQASEEREEHKTVVQAEEVDFDTAVGMIYSTVIDYFIIVSAAVMLFGKNIETVKDAALALKPVAGNYSFALFSIGVIVSGFLSIPVLSGSSAYAVADAFGWREGLDYKVSDAKGFYIVFLGALILGDLIDLSPVSTVDALYYSQVLDGVLLPILIVMILLISNNKRIMGEFTNSRFNNIFCSLTLIVTSVLSAIMFYQLINKV